MGLLDYLKGVFDQTTGNNDPMPPTPANGLLALSSKDKSGALGQALFQAGMGILSAKTGGNIGAAIGQGGMQGVQAYGSAIDDLKREKLQGYQIQRQQQREATQDERQAKLDGYTDINFNNQQTQFQQSQAKTQAMQELAKKHLKPDGSFDQNGYVAELYQYDPKEAMDYREKMDLAGERRASMALNREISNKAQFGGQEIMKDEAGNLFYGTTIRDPRTQQIVPSIVAADGSGVKPQGRLMIANNSYGLTAGEKVQQVGNEKTAELSAGAKGAAKAEMKGFGTTMAAIERAKEILPTATDSLVGRGRDAVFGAFGATTKAAQDASELDTTAGWLMTNVPKFSGPQSDKDVMTYNIMAGQVGDRSKPHAERLRSLQTLEQFMKLKNQENEALVGSGQYQQPSTQNNNVSANQPPQRTFKVLR